MLSIQLEVSAKSRQMMREMPGLVVPALTKGMRESMLLVERSARTSISGGHLGMMMLQRRSGRLRASITSRVKIEGDRVTGVLGSNVIYARIHELGGIIRARNAKALVFKIPGVGWRQAQSVTIPARPYLRPAITRNLDAVGQIISGRIEEAFNG